MNNIFVTFQGTNMWQYATPISDISENLITRKYLLNLILSGRAPHITREAVHYIRELLRPFIEQLNSSATQDQVNQIYQNLPRNNVPQLNRDLVKAKYEVLNAIICLITWDGIYSEGGIGRHGSIINPWDVYHYIKSDKILKEFFQPNRVKVTVKGETMVIGQNKLLGIMAIHRFLHKDSPFSINGSHLKSEIKKINAMALAQKIIDDDGWFNIMIGNETYSFHNIKFVQGCILGCKWNDIPSGDVLSHFIQWKCEPLFFTGKCPKWGEPLMSAKKYAIEMTIPE